MSTKLKAKPLGHGKFFVTFKPRGAAKSLIPGDFPNRKDAETYVQLLRNTLIMNHWGRHPNDLANRRKHS